MRRTTRSPSALLVAAFAAFMLVIAGCGEEEGTGSGGSIPADALKGKSITVGSKDSTEQKLLAVITIQVLKAAGATVKDKTGLVGNVAAREALTSGDIDLYWEYTGTAWQTYLREKAIPDERKQYQAVAAKDLEVNKIRWLEPAPANNTYTFAVRSESYERFGVRKISDFETLISTIPGEASVCVGEQFSTRKDGLPGVEKAYAFKFPKVIKLEEEGLIYGEINQGVDKGGTCNFGQVFITDGRISANNLRTIEDDKSFFPKNNPALNVREEVLKANPQLEAIFRPVAAKLDSKKLQDLNAEVEVNGVPDDKVVQEWLKEGGFIG